MARSIFPPLLLSLFALSFSATAAPKAEPLPEVVDFNDHIQPILSEYCYHCHGPDSSTREPKKAPLRLDREEFAFEIRSNGKPTIIKGDAEKSAIIQRILSPDPDIVMPTPEAHKEFMGEHKVALLKKWINQGADYEEHWSFEKPIRPAVPDEKWGHNAVDKFMAAKHNEIGLNPNKPAPPHRLLRRLSFDLTGLPPTADEIAAFESAFKSDPEAAVAEATDRLLKTDAYAENFARHWLDAARYADTHGIHIDNYRSIWPYRDWVINAFRENKSFKDFTIEQIAGDLLPNPTIPQKVATGFNRCLPTTGEGGAIREEYEFIYATDRVETTSAIWLGLTTGCAACHDHKFDPVSQRDFYEMSAFFRNTTMDAMDGNKAVHEPATFAPARGDLERWQTVQAKLRGFEKELADRRKTAKPDFEAWIEKQGTTPLETKVPTPEVDIPMVVENKKFHGIIKGENKTWSFTKRLREHKGFGKIPTIVRRNTELGDFAQFNGGDQITFAGHIWGDSTNGPVISRMDTTKKHKGWDIWMESSRLGVHLIEEYPGRAIKVTTKSPIPRKEWQHFVITYDGKAPQRQQVQIYLNGVAQPIEYHYTARISDLTAPDVPVRLGARHPDANRIQGSILFHGFQFFRQILSPDQVLEARNDRGLNPILSVPIKERSKPQNKRLFDYFLTYHDPVGAEIKERQKPVLEEENHLRSRGAMTLVMKEKNEAPFAHILDRGDYSLKKDKVTPQLPSLFRPGGAESSQENLNRLDLAKWLVSEDNPLTPRVTVNRLWYYIFGRGLVETTEDFGIMGARPTHPELLDYLAVEFVESGWDLQHILRLITNSATYQQSGKVESANRAIDPTNLYLSRHPRRRMDAEQIRDLALTAAELLNPEIGGPSVKPYQPEGIWEAVAMNQSNTRFYKQDQGDKNYRRSLYTFWKRTAPNPSMEILNAPTREVFCVRRDLTNTPLQAFVTLNDPQFIESSRALAENALQKSSDFDERLDHLTIGLLGRLFRPEEREIVKKTHETLKARYQEVPKLAVDLIEVGEKPPAPGIEPTELAPWTVIASQILNLDETLTK